MKKYPTVFHLVATELAKAKVPYLIIGGFAVNAYGYGRSTGDFDLLMTDKGFAQASPFLEDAGYRIVSHQRVCARLEYQERDPSFMDMDVVLVDKPTFEGMQKLAVETDILGNKFRIPALDHLMAMKLHALKNNPKRDQDVLDLVQLMRKHGLDADTPRFRDLCLTYATEEWYGKIKAKWKTWKS